MIHKSRATCKDGHIVEFGPCNKESRSFFIFKSVCTSTDYEVISADEIQCRRCNTIHNSRSCPKCNELVPVAQFKQRRQVERLRR
jgi:hypothetical protein